MTDPVDDVPIVYGKPGPDAEVFDPITAGLDRDTYARLFPDRDIVEDGITMDEWLVLEEHGVV